MFLILDELKEMIVMEGGDVSRINDIGLAVKTLKELMVSKKKAPVEPPVRESRRSRKAENEYSEE